MDVNAIKTNLTDCILPFWMNLKDKDNGGFYGLVDPELKVDKKADKGVILCSRILWTFSNAYLTLDDMKYLEYAKQAYVFLRDKCVDKERGGVYWSVTFDGKPADTQKHSYKGNDHNRHCISCSSENTAYCVVSGHSPVEQRQRP